MNVQNLNHNTTWETEVTTEYYTDIEIDIGNICNLKCPLCHRNNFTDEKYELNTVHMSLETIKEIDNKFPNLQRWYLGFLINEPTLNPNFIEIVSYLKSKNKNITLSTNGNTFATNSDKDTLFWNTFLNLLDKNDKIIWPLDGLTQEVYAMYRKKGSLEKLIYNIFRATEINPNIDHTIQTILFKHNQEQIRTLLPQFKLIHNPVWYNPTWSLIDCCGDCALLSDEAQPVWDKEQWRKIKANPPKSGKITCESKENKIIFVDHEGRIGFCPTQLTGSILDGRLENKYIPTVLDDINKINKYINFVYRNKESNKICQFNCGEMAKLKKERYKLNGIATK